MSSVNAPILLMWQTRAVLQVFGGRDGGWPAQTRGDGRLTLSEAAAAGWWIQIWGAAMVGLTYTFAPELMLWVLPVGVPLLIAPFVIWATSHPSQASVFLTPEEHSLPPIIARHRQVMTRWGKASEAVDRDETAPAAQLSA